MGEPTQETFLRDVEKHKMEIVRNDGNNRHVIFSQPGTYNMRFELITWPGHLCYTGDMGTFVFRRLDDMFAFFRTDRRGDDRLYINLGYWAEKLEATDRGDGHRRWSSDKFTAVIQGYLEDASDELREAVKDEVLSRADDGQHEAYQAANSFEHDGFRFNDLWDHDFEEYTYRFIWCCYALAWGIKQYDQAQQSTAISV